MADLLKRRVLFAKEATVPLGFISNKDWTVENRRVIYFNFYFIFMQRKTLLVWFSVSLQSWPGGLRTVWTVQRCVAVSLAGPQTLWLFSCFIFRFIAVLTLPPFLKFSSSNVTFWFCFRFFFFLNESQENRWSITEETKIKKTRNCKRKWMFCSEIEFWLSAFFSTYFPKKCFQASLTGSPTLQKCTSLQKWRSPDGVSWSVPSGATTLHSADLLLGRRLPTPATFRRKLTVRRNHPCTFLSTQRKVSTCFYSTRLYFVPNRWLNDRWINEYTKTKQYWITKSLHGDTYQQQNENESYA